MPKISIGSKPSRTIFGNNVACSIKQVLVVPETQNRQKGIHKRARCPYFAQNKLKKYDSVAVLSILLAIFAAISLLFASAL